MVDPRLFAALGAGGPVPVPPSPLPDDARIDDLVRRLVVALQEQSRGIAVRQLPNQAPPWRCQPLYFSHQAALGGQAGAIAMSEIRFGVQWNPNVDGGATVFGIGNAFTDGLTFGLAPTAPLDTAEQFPNGMVGVLTRVEVYAYQLTVAAVLNAHRQCRWSLFLDGAAVPGCLHQPVSTWQEMQATAAGAPARQAIPFDGSLRVPLVVMPGQRLELSYLQPTDLAAAVTVQWLSVVQGYAFPSYLVTDPSQAV